MQAPVQQSPARTRKENDRARPLPSPVRLPPSAPPSRRRAAYPRSTPHDADTPRSVQRTPHALKGVHAKTREITRRKKPMVNPLRTVRTAIVALSLLGAAAVSGLAPLSTHAAQSHFNPTIFNLTTV